MHRLDGHVQAEGESVAQGSKKQDAHAYGCR